MKHPILQQLDDLQQIVEALQIPEEDWSKTNFGHGLDRVDTRVLADAAQKLRPATQQFSALQRAIQEEIARRDTEGGRTIR